MKAVLYSRVSTEEEKQMNALGKQVDELEKFIDSQPDWILVDKYIDEGKSGTTSKGRYQYNRLYEDLLTDKFDIVVIKDQSRLMRNVLDWYLFLDRLSKNNKKLFMYLDNAYYTPDNAFLNGIKAMMAEEYSRDLSKKINSAVKRSQKNGTVYGNNRLIGYRQEKGKLYIKENEATVVRKVFDLYIQGYGFRSISIILEDEGIFSSQGTPLGITTLKRMIRNEKYKGLLISGKKRKNFETKKIESVPEDEWIRIPNGVPAIVSEEVWDKANSILKERRIKSKTDETKVYGYFQGETYPLSGKIYCAKCGAVYWHDYCITKVNKLERHKWMCSTYKKYGTVGCSNKILRDDFLLEALKKILFEVYNNKEAIAETLEILKESLNQEKPDNRENLQKQIDKYKTRIDSLLDVMLDGTISKQEYLDKKSQIEEKINSLRQQIESESLYLNQNPKESIESRLLKIKDFLEHPIENYTDISDETVKELVEKIVVNDNQCDVYLYTGEQINLDFFDKHTHSKDLNEQEYACVVETRQLRPHTETLIYNNRIRRTKKHGEASWQYFNIYVTI